MKKIILSAMLMGSNITMAATNMTVTTAVPVSMDIPFNVPVQGVVVAENNSAIRPELTGVVIQKLYKNIGDQVKKGDVLAVFDTTAITLERQKALAVEQESKIAWEKALSEYKRVSLLPVGESVSVESVKTYAFAEQSAKARYNANVSARKSIEHTLQKGTLRAPFDGIIIERSMQLGSLSSTNEGFTLVSTTKEWRPLLNAQYAGLLKKGISITYQEARLPVRAWTPSANTNRQIMLRASAKPEMIVGYSYSGNIQLGSEKGLTVPRSSVLMKDKLYAVMAVENGKVKRIPVTVTDKGGDRLIIKGVTPQTHVIIKGMNFVNHGDTVKEVAQ